VAINSAVAVNILSRIGCAE